MLRCLVCCCIDVRISYLMVHVLNSDITWFLPPTWKIFQLESHYHQTHLSGYYGTWSYVSTYAERPLIHGFYFTLCVSKRDQTADVHLSRLSTVWLGSQVVSVLDSGAEGPGFKSQPRRCPVTVLGKLFTPVVPLFTKQQKIGSSPLKGCEGNCRPGRK